MNKIQSWSVVLVLLLTLVASLAWYDCLASIADHREITPFTKWVTVLFTAEHLALLLGSWSVYRYTPELVELRQAKSENIGLRTKLMFAEQSCRGLLKTVKRMEGKAAPLAAAKRLGRNQEKSQPSLEEEPHDASERHVSAV